MKPCPRCKSEMEENKGYSHNKNFYIQREQGTGKIYYCDKCQSEYFIPFKQPTFMERVVEIIDNIDQERDCEGDPLNIQSAAQEIYSLHKSEVEQLKEEVKRTAESRDFWKNEYRRLK
jgi:hypothetical protein